VPALAATLAGTLFAHDLREEHSIASVKREHLAVTGQLQVVLRRLELDDQKIAIDANESCGENRGRDRSGSLEELKVDRDEPAHTGTGWPTREVTPLRANPMQDALDHDRCLEL
jgi:hypothetical protein